MFKNFLSLLITMLPLNCLRITFLRLLFNYDISYDSYIGMFNLIKCNTCIIKGGTIGWFNKIQSSKFKMAQGSEIKNVNRFINLNSVIINSNAVICEYNTFIGTRPGLTPFKTNENITLGTDSIITRRHSFDLSDSITIGKNVTFAGFRTQIWTHGFDINHVKIQSPVAIGSNCYIGSTCIFSLGVNIKDQVSIGSGTVVSKSIEKSGFYVSSQLLRKGDVHNFIDHKDIINYKGYKFVKK